MFTIRNQQKLSSYRNHIFEIPHYNPRLKLVNIAYIMHIIYSYYAYKKVISKLLLPPFFKKPIIKHKQNPPTGNENDLYIPLIFTSSNLI